MKCQAARAHEEPGLASSCCHCHPLTVEVAATAGEALMQLQVVRQRTFRRTCTRASCDLGVGAQPPAPRRHATGADASLAAAMQLSAQPCLVQRCMLSSMLNVRAAWLYALLSRAESRAAYSSTAARAAA